MTCYKRSVWLELNCSDAEVVSGKADRKRKTVCHWLRDDMKLPIHMCGIWGNMFLPADIYWWYQSYFGADHSSIFMSPTHEPAPTF